MIHVSMTTDEMYEKLESLLNRVEGEWVRFPYNDKYEYYHDTFKYQFENGDVVEFTFIGTHTFEIRNLSILDFWAARCEGRVLSDPVVLILSRIASGSKERVAH